MRPKYRMIFKVGLTVIIFVAIYMYNALNKENELNTGDKQSDIATDDSGNTIELEQQEKEAKRKEEERILREKTRWAESIHLAVVACGDRGNETIIMLKSAVMFTKSNLIFHIFTEDELKQDFKNQLDAWPQPHKDKTEYHLYSISYPDSENAAVWKKLFKPCASQRLFFPSLLTNVDSLLYVDTDVLFVRSLDDIYGFFKKFNSTQMAALSPEHESKSAGWYNRFARHPYYGELGLNSGVMLMNLTRMRNSTWIDSMISYHEEYKLRIVWGDQDLINIYFHFYPGHLFVYPCEWNFRPDHCMYMSVCEGAKKDGASVIHGSRRVMHNDKQPAFKSLYNAFKEYDMTTSIKSNLFPVLKKNLKEVETTPCGKEGHIFTKQIEKYIQTEAVTKQGEKNDS